MKTKILLVITFILISTFSYSQNIDKQTAGIVAENYFSAFTKRENICISEIIPNYNKDVLTFYAVNFNGGGFVIVSSDNSITPILMVSQSGSFSDIENFIPPQQYFFHRYNDEIYNALSDRNRVNRDNETKWNTLLSKNLKINFDSIGPLTTTFWAQYRTNDKNQTQYTKCHGYNFYVPDTHKKCLYCSHKCYVGCGATAMAQILKYWNFADINGYNIYDWANMRDSLLYKDGDNSNFQEELYAIGHLSADCGYFSKTDYCTIYAWIGGQDRCQSSTKTSNIKDGFKMLGYDDVNLLRRGWYSDKNWIKRLKNNIKAGRPVFYSYLEIDTSKGIQGGHSIVADGYYYDELTETHLFHFNFGWAGSSNDWYNIDSIYAGVDNETKYERMIIDIYPTNTDNSCNENLNLWDFYANGGLDDDDFPWQAVPIVKNLYSADLSAPEEYRTIQNGDDITYVAYNSIVLRQGFSVRSGGKFHAYLTDCPAQKTSYKSSDNQPNNIEKSNFQIEKSPTLEIYPNPASNYIRISYFLPQQTDYSIEIYDIFGKKIKILDQANKNEGNYEFSINLSYLQNGVYLCILKTSQGIVSQRIIKI